ncbi:hypothetical protein [Mastigocladopsis repens]|uniref:hypothetical protein n=1 Tax=Mastigocladopsis repens TaxID=221287 RepID=UPI0002F6878B|nr:hypothetical protein [Mastigocladopsis repens]
MLGNRKSKDTHRLGLKARLSAKRHESSADAIRAVVCRVTAGLTAPVFAVTGWLAMTSSSMAVTASYRNDFRVCAGRLLSVGITAEAASQACAEALRPGDLSSCVTRIGRQTQLAAPDVLATCRQARRPEQVSDCVVGISRYTRESDRSEVLNYCGRSLLPVRFADCVVGLRAEIDFASTQAMESCIDASDRIRGYLPSFIPANNQPTEFRPNFESTPTPAAPSQTPAESTPTPAAPSQTPANPSSK